MSEDKTMLLDSEKIMMCLFDKDMSVDGLAVELGMTRQAIYRALSERTTKFDTVSRIAGVLQVDPITLVKSE